MLISVLGLPMNQCWACHQRLVRPALDSQHWWYAAPIGLTKSTTYERPTFAMTELLRQEIAATANRIVVKVGTRVLTDNDGQLDTHRIALLAEEVSAIRKQGRQIVLVSSGAVGAGMGLLRLTDRPQSLSQLQAIAAIGQARLIELYDQHFRQHGFHAAQVLLTADDVDDRQRYLNVRNTVLALLEMEAIPVINENDTVAVDELMTTFGDNDRLAAVVTNLLRAPLLVILSDVDGLYDRSPDEPDAAVIPTVHRIDDVMKCVVDNKTERSKGGMASKLAAARMATAAGENVIVASGHQQDVLPAILRGETVGTLFIAEGKSVTPRKRWIGFSSQTKGRLLLDAGASQAVVEHGRSLLPIGIVAVEGEFEKGDVVAVINSAGQEVARGLTNYDAADTRAIKQQQSHLIAGILGHCPYAEVIHRDNLHVSGC